ncbi:MAG: hypothetical protein ABFD66_00460 [Smithella sp.]
MIAPWFTILYIKLEKVAHRHGYCLAIHGSMTRDLDLVLIPWTEDAEDSSVVLEAFDKVVIEELAHRKRAKKKGYMGKALDDKPHGRKATVFYLGYSDYYLDVSIMPRVIETEVPGGKDRD